MKAEITQQLGVSNKNYRNKTYCNLSKCHNKLYRIIIIIIMMMMIVMMMIMMIIIIIMTMMMIVIMMMRMMIIIMQPHTQGTFRKVLWSIVVTCFQSIAQILGNKTIYFEGGV